jgi:archaellum component FlaC
MSYKAAEKLKTHIELEFIKSMSPEEINAAFNQFHGQIAELKAENERLKEAIKDINQTYKDSSGYEPSISVFHRELDEAMQLVGK